MRVKSHPVLALACIVVLLPALSGCGLIFG